MALTEEVSPASPLLHDYQVVKLSATAPAPSLSASHHDDYGLSKTVGMSLIKHFLL